MSRFATEVGNDHRSELIVFYIEPLSRNQASLAEFPDGGPANENFDRLSHAVTRRSLAAVELSGADKREIEADQGEGPE